MGRFSQDDQADAVDALVRAPFEQGAWLEAMELFGRAGGGWTGQLLGIDLRFGAQFNLTGGVSAEVIAEFERLGGAMIGVNPRVAPGIFQQPYGIVADDDFITADERRRSAFYQGFYASCDADYVSLARMPDFGSDRVLACVIRSRTQGHAQAEDHARMARLLPHIDAALRVQSALNAREIGAAVRSLDALTIAAFLCDRWGRVVASTAAADALARRAGVVSLDHGMLRAADAGATAGLQRALDFACRGDGDATTIRAATLALRDAQGGVHRIDVSPIARAIDGFPSTAAAIVAVTETPPVADPGALLQQGYGLTAAEAAVALDVTAGYSSTEIAARRGASTATVRVQIKAALAKTDMTKSAALAALIARLTG